MIELFILSSFIVRTEDSVSVFSEDEQKERVLEKGSVVQFFFLGRWDLDGTTFLV